MRKAAKKATITTLRFEAAPVTESIALYKGLLRGRPLVSFPPRKALCRAQKSRPYLTVCIFYGQNSNEAYLSDGAINPQFFKM